MKTINHLKLLASAAAVMATLTLPGTGLAGSTTPDAPSCVKNTDGSGWCNGSMQGYRNTANTSDLVEFEQNLGNGWTYFYAYLNGVNYSCYPNTTIAAKFAAASAARGYFYVVWDTTGTCNTFYVTNESNDL